MSTLVLTIFLFGCIVSILAFFGIKQLLNELNDYEILLFFKK